MELGNFSVSLAVKDLATSRAFYESLGFEVIGGDPAHNFQILRNGESIIGLFQGMFDGNILTFNPGWTKDQETLKTFDDVRTIQSALQEQGIALESKTDVEADGPASFMLKDPDGNMILVDQHVPKPS